MKRSIRITALTLAAGLTLAAPAHTSCAVRNLAKSAKGYKQVHTVSDAGVYKLNCEFKETLISDSDAFHFAAPAAGTYTFLFEIPSENDEYDDEFDAKDSLTFGGSLDFNDSSSFGLKAPALRETSGKGIGLASYYRGTLCIKEFPPRVKWKYKLKKNERVIFFAFGAGCTKATEQELKIKMTIE